MYSANSSISFASLTKYPIFAWHVGVSPRDPCAVKKRSPKVSRTKGLQEVRGRFGHPLYFIGKMKKERAKSEFELGLKLRMSDKLALRLLWLLMGGTAIAAGFSHWIK
jgi:hypothetical protein